MPRVAGRVVASMLAGVFLLVSVGAVVAAEDWPTYQGDNGRTGVRGEILDEAAVEVLWTFQTGSVNVHSTPAVVGGTVYFGAGDGGIYAVNATSGELVWVVETASRVRASPAVVDGVVYIGAEDGNVYALNSTNGDVVWTSEVGAGLRASPAVSNDTVVVVADNGTVIALDRANGTRKWSVPTEARSEA